MYLFFYRVDDLEAFLVWLEDFERFSSVEIQAVAFRLRSSYQIRINIDAGVDTHDLCTRGHGRQGGAVGWVK